MLRQGQCYAEANATPRPMLRRGQCYAEANATPREDAMVGIAGLVLALLVGAGVFAAAYRFLKQLGGAPESDTGLYVEPPVERGDEEA